MRGETSRRGGFTIVEVLVTVTIIAVMLALMVPAIRTSHQTAMRAQCLNNMRQVSLALQNHEVSLQYLPPGVIDAARPIHNVAEGGHVGWITQLLPFLEQRALVVDTGTSVYDPVNAGAAGTQIRTLHCPSDPYKATPGVLGLSSYAACHNDVEAPIDVDNHGVFFLNSRLRQDDIHDGTSSTIYFGEKVLTPDDLGWMSGTRATLRNTGWALNAPKPRPNVQADGDDLVVDGFSSDHPGGANFGFGDGSIRFIKNRIDPRVYRLLGHRDDGEMVPGTGRRD